MNLSLDNMDNLSDERKERIMGQVYTISEKYDGVKLTLIRNSKPYSKYYVQNWIVAYKGHVIYPNEFLYATNITNSMGASQFKIVHDLLCERNEYLEELPRNTEFQIEFIMNKPTITRNYNIFHSMYLIDCVSIENIEINFGKVKTEPMPYTTDATGLNKKLYAKALGIKVPHVFVNNSKLMDKFDTYELMKQELLSKESNLGGHIEGVVFESNDRKWKLVQEDQYDSNTRNKKKNLHRYENKGLELDYWNEVYSYAEEVVISIFTTYSQLSNMLEHLGKIIYHDNGIAELPMVKHNKKSLETILDDIHLTAKTILIKNLSGNNGVLIPGRFQPPTKSHIKIFENALLEYDKVIINIVNNVRSERNPFTFNEISNMIMSCISDNTDKLILQQTRSGNIVNMINKSSSNINAVICGTDRYDCYAKQLTNKGAPKLIEIERKDDISGTKIRSMVRGGNYNSDFLKFMHPELEHQKKCIWNTIRNYSEC